MLKLLNTHKFWLLIITTSTLVLVVFLKYYWLIDRYSNSLNIYFVLALVSITAYYAYTTQQLVKESQEGRHLQARPILIPTCLTVRDPHAQGDTMVCMTCDISNMGNGPAFSIHVLLCDPESKQVLARSTHFIDFLTKESETDDNHIHISNKKFSNLNYKEIGDKMTAKVIVKIHYNDSFGNTYISERALSLKKNEAKFTPLLGSFKLNSYI
jgi:hypothetical protein